MAKTRMTHYGRLLRYVQEGKRRKIHWEFENLAELDALSKKLPIVWQGMAAFAEDEGCLDMTIQIVPVDQLPWWMGKQTKDSPEEDLEEEIDLPGEEPYIGMLVQTMLVGHIVNARLLRQLSPAPGASFRCRFISHYPTGAKTLLLDTGQNWHIRHGEEFTTRQEDILRASAAIEKEGETPPSDSKTAGRDWDDPVIVKRDGQYWVALSSQIDILVEALRTGKRYTGVRHAGPFSSLEGLFIPHPYMNNARVVLRDSPVQTMMSGSIVNAKVVRQYSNDKIKCRFLSRFPDGSDPDGLRGTEFETTEADIARARNFIADEYARLIRVCERQMALPAQASELIEGRNLDKQTTASPKATSIDKMTVKQMRDCIRHHNRAHDQFEDRMDVSPRKARREELQAFLNDNKAILGLPGGADTSKNEQSCILNVVTLREGRVEEVLSVVGDDAVALVPKAEEAFLQQCRAYGLTANEGDVGFPDMDKGCWAPEGLQLVIQIAWTDTITQEN